MLQSLLNVDMVNYYRVYLQPNQLEIEGQLLQIGFPSYLGRFFDVLTLEGNNGFKSKKQPHLLVQMDYMISQNIKQLKRNAYSLNELIGDLGGVYEILFTVFAFLMSPFSRHSFIMSLLETNFLVV